MVSKECKEVKISIFSQRIVCSARKDTPCEDFNYLSYDYKNCPKLNGTEHDLSIERTIFRFKTKCIKAINNFIKKFRS